jgi:3',5'-cyclic AMP phosphodiesterase CpdA
MAAVDSITLLHVSDMQFGRNHRFGQLGAVDPDGSFDTLYQRLSDDLAGLKKDLGLTPQLVIASGDLAEWGLPKEFADVRQFLEKLPVLTPGVWPCAASGSCASMRFPTSRSWSGTRFRGPSPARSSSGSSSTPATGP